MIVLVSADADQSLGRCDTNRDGQSLVPSWGFVLERRVCFRPRLCENPLPPRPSFA